MPLCKTQSFSLQFSVSDVSPTQLSTKHDRSRDRQPPPQVAEHSDQSDHSDNSGQSASRHSRASNSTTESGHAPGPLQNRFRRCLPVPHDLLQAVHSPHSAGSPISAGHAFSGTQVFPDNLKPPTQRQTPTLSELSQVTSSLQLSTSQGIAQASKN